jgi:hypothetical protein
MKTSRKRAFALSGIVLILVGLSLIIAGIVVPTYLEDKLIKYGIQLSVMKDSNVDSWALVPGQREYTKTHQIYLYSIKNLDEVGIVFHALGKIW